MITIADAVRDAIYVAVVVVLSLLLYVVAERCEENRAACERMENQIVHMQKLVGTDKNVDRFIRQLRAQGISFNQAHTPAPATKEN